MFNTRALALTAATLSLLSTAFGAFDASSNSNVAVYWGQGPDQKPLSHFCADANIDIVIIGFLNKFPDQTKGLPGTNFGNQCGPDTFKNKDGSDSPFLKGCENIGADITTCQKAGKKVFLSLGGAIPSDQTVKDDESAENFAEILWTSFGPKSSPTAPRPFGDAVIDGFDFDIESSLVEGQDPKDLYRGYSSLINALRKYFLFANRDYYISGAPQCVIPDAHLANAIQTSWFDFIFVQFYNTRQCGARAYFDHTYGQQDNGGKATDISFDGWINFVKTQGLNKKAKVYLGLPASKDVVIEAVMYLQPNEAKEIIEHFQTKYPTEFGGVMLYEATASENNLIDGKPYLDVIKEDLNKDAEVSTSASISPSSTKASSSASDFPTLIPSSLPFGLAPPSSSGAPYPVPSGSGLSSSPPYPMPSGSGLSSSPPYPIPSGSASPSGPTGSSRVVVPPGSASSKSGTAPYTVKTSTAPSASGSSGPSVASSGSLPSGSGSLSAPYPTGTAPSGSGSSGPSGVSSGSFPSGTGSSNGPYPSGNSSAPVSSTRHYSFTTASGEQVVSSTAVVTISSCAPEVTNCPYASHPVVSTQTHISTIHLASSGSVPTGGPSSAPSNSPQSSNEISSSQSVPAGGSSAASNSPQTTQEVVTTAIVTSYVTTCPVTSTTTSSGSQVVETGSTVSTVYSTIISTICTKCVAPGPTSTAVVSIPGGGHQGPALPIGSVPASAPQEASPSATVSQSQSPFTGTASPSGPIQEVVTTVIKFTTLTTCPVTNTVTLGTSEIVQVTQVVSTITSTKISTICTKCVAPPTGAPVPGSGAQAPPSSTSIAGIPGAGHQGPAVPMPAGPSNDNSSPANSHPAGSSPESFSSPSEGAENGTQGGSGPVSSGNTGSSGSSPSSHGSEAPAGSNNSPAASNPESVAQAPAASPASAHTISSIYHPVKTLTIVPIPVNPSQTASPKSPVQSAEEASGVPSEAVSASTPSNSEGQGSLGVPSSNSPGSNAPSESAAEGAAPAPAPAIAPPTGNAAPFPANNVTAPAGPSGTTSPSSVGTQALPSVVAFQGAASRIGGGFFGIVAFMVAAALIL